MRPAAKSSGPGSPPSCSPATSRPPRAARLRIGVAEPAQYWSCADIHCRVFLDAGASDAAHSSAASSQSQWGTGWDKPIGTQAPLGFLGPIVVQWQALQHSLQRVDTVIAMQTNDMIARAGHGRCVLLVAGDDAATSDVTPQDPGTATPRPVLAETTTALMLPPVTRPGIGVTPEARGWVAIATLDSFGDKVPPRALTLAKDGAMGALKRQGVAYISNVAVLPAARRQGVARQLVQEAERMAADWGCRATGLHCNPKNVAAMALYEGMGYRRTSILEDPWMPWLMGRPPDRCMFLIKRLAPGGQSAAATGRAA